MDGMPGGLLVFCNSKVVRPRIKSTLSVLKKENALTNNCCLLRHPTFSYDTSSTIFCFVTLLHGSVELRYSVFGNSDYMQTICLSVHLFLAAQFKTWYDLIVISPF